MATDHEHWQAQGEIYALGALEGDELKNFEAHLASGCQICQAYLRETCEALLLLHRVITPMTPAAAVKTRVMEQIGGGKVVALPLKPRSAGRRWQIFTGTIAAGIIGAVIAGVYYTKLYEPRHTVYTAVVNLLRDPTTRDYPLYGTGPTPVARGRFLWNESGEGHIFVSNLPPAPEGKMYAVWTIAQASAPRYAGTITTDSSGQGGLHINFSKSDKAVETFAVTLEPVGTTTAPTGPMVLVSKQS